jgi:hypothetical protein
MSLKTISKPTRTTCEKGCIGPTDWAHSTTRKDSAGQKRGPEALGCLGPKDCNGRDHEGRDRPHLDQANPMRPSKRGEQSAGPAPARWHIAGAALYCRHVRARHLQAHLGRDCCAVPADARPAGGESCRTDRSPSRQLRAKSDQVRRSKMQTIQSPRLRERGNSPAR